MFTFKQKDLPMICPSYISLKSILEQQPEICSQCFKPIDRLLTTPAPEESIINEVLFFLLSQINLF